MSDCRHVHYHASVTPSVPTPPSHTAPSPHASLFPPRPSPLPKNAHWGVLSTTYLVVNLVVDVVGYNDTHAVTDAPASPRGGVQVRCRALLFSPTSLPHLDLSPRDSLSLPPRRRADFEGPHPSGTAGKGCARGGKRPPDEAKRGLVGRVRGDELRQPRPAGEAAHPHGGAEAAEEDPLTVTHADIPPPLRRLP